MPGARLLIDGDRLVRLFATRVEAGARDHLTRNVHAQEEKTILELNTYIAGLQHRFAAPPPVIAFSDPAHFRRRLYGDYQAYSHFETHGSLLHRGLLNYIRRNLNCEGYAGMESADVLGVLATAPNPENLRRFGIGSSRLLESVPGEWLDMHTGEVKMVAPFAADVAFYRHTLLGNPADNYEGCPGMNAEAADALLHPFARQEETHAEQPALWHKAVWAAVAAAYGLAGQTAADALLCARLSRVLRFEDYDFKNREVKFWQPPAG